MKKAEVCPASFMDEDLALVHVVADAAVTQFPPSAWVLLWVDRRVGDAAIVKDSAFGSHRGVQLVGVVTA